MHRMSFDIHCKEISARDTSKPWLALVLFAALYGMFLSLAIF